MLFDKAVYQSRDERSVFPICMLYTGLSDLSILSIFTTSVHPRVFSPRVFLATCRPTLWTTFSRGDPERWKQEEERKEERKRERQLELWGAEGTRGEGPDGGAPAVARGSRRRTCLHLFQRARRWVVTSRVGRHGNLLGLPKRGSIVLPVKTARDPDLTHMDSWSWRSGGYG